MEVQRSGGNFQVHGAPVIEVYVDARHDHINGLVLAELIGAAIREEPIVHVVAAEDQDTVFADLGTEKAQLVGEATSHIVQSG